MNHCVITLGGSLAIALACGVSAQSVSQSPTSSASPYVRPLQGGPAVDVVSFLTVGDSVNLGADGVTPYRMVGLPDGLGAYDNGDGTMTLLVAQELTSTAGGVRHAHQPAGFAGGAFVSRWVIRTAPGADFLRVVDGQDLMTSVATVSNGTGGSLFNFNRFCSADLADSSAYFNPATGRGTTERIFLAGEEGGAGGRVIATGVVERKGYELPAFNPLLGGWENALARPLQSDTTVVMATSDGGENRVFIYVGTKQDTGNLVERAGLMNGAGYGVQVQLDGVNVGAESRDFCFAASGAAAYSARFAFTPGASGTKFLRPEDGAWDVAHPNDFYFVTTDRIDTTEIGGTQVARSRLFRMRFDDASNPLAGGTIEALLTGTEGQNMLDNMCVFSDASGGTRILCQEDPGNSVHNAKTWLYTVANDSMIKVLESDPARFGDLTLPATAPFNVDEENSGVIDAREVLGLGWFIGTAQSHYGIAGELVEGGQLYAFYLPMAVNGCSADIGLPLDGIVDGRDLGALLGNWGNAGTGDLDSNGTVDGADLGLLLGAWGACGQ